MSVESTTNRIKKFLKDEYNINIQDNKVIGLAIETEKLKGTYSSKDKYGNYKHVNDITQILNDRFNGIFSQDDITYLTGNLMYTMRLNTRKILETLEELHNIYTKKIIDGKIFIDKKQFDTDMEVLKETVKKIVSDTWKDIEKRQTKGVGIIISKIKN